MVCAYDRSGRSIGCVENILRLSHVHMFIIQFEMIKLELNSFVEILKRKYYQSNDAELGLFVRRNEITII